MSRPEGLGALAPSELAKTERARELVQRGTERGVENGEPSKEESDAHDYAPLLSLPATKKETADETPKTAKDQQRERPNVSAEKAAGALLWLARLEGKVELPDLVHRLAAEVLPGPGLDILLQHGCPVSGIGESERQFEAVQIVLLKFSRLTFDPQGVAFQAEWRICFGFVHGFFPVGSEQIGPAERGYSRYFEVNANNRTPDRIAKVGQ